MAVQALLVAMGSSQRTKPVLNYTFTADTLVGNLHTWFTSNVGGYLGNSGYSVVNVTINSGVTLGYSDYSQPALYISGWASDCTFNITNNGTIHGAGGYGGNAAPNGYANNGWPGAAAFQVDSGQGPVNMTNNGTISGGSGGGGGAIGNYSYCSSSDPKYGACTGYSTAYTSAGGGGGRGYSGGLGGSSNGGSDGSAGSRTGAGSGGSQTNASGGAGGSALAATGSSGSGNQASGSGGAAGNAVTGNAYITWLATGTRNGTVA